MNKGAVVRLVCSETKVESYHIGRIEVHPRYSFFEIDEGVSKMVLPKMKEGTYEGKSFNVSLNQESKPGK